LRLQKSIGDRDIEDREAKEASPTPPAGKVPKGRVVCAPIAPPATLVSLTWLRHYSLYRSFIIPRSSTRNVDEKLDLLLLKTKTRLLRSDLEPHLQAARSREN